MSLILSACAAAVKGPSAAAAQQPEQAQQQGTSQAPPQPQLNGLPPISVGSTASSALQQPYATAAGAGGATAGIGQHGDLLDAECLWPCDAVLLHQSAGKFSQDARFWGSLVGAPVWYREPARLQQLGLPVCLVPAAYMWASR